MKRLYIWLKRLYIWLKRNFIIALPLLIWGLLGFTAFLTYLIKYGAITWVVLSGCATWVLAGGVFLAVWQINEAKKSTNAQIAFELFKEIRSEKAVEILRYIYELNPGGPMIMHKVDEYSVDFVLDRFDVLGVLVRKGLVDEELAVDAYAGVSVLRSWYVLRKWIQKERITRKYFGYNVEGFANVCMEYFHARGMEVGFNNKYDPVDDLIKKFKDAESEEEDKDLYPRSWDKIRKDLKGKKK